MHLYLEPQTSLTLSDPRPPSIHTMAAPALASVATPPHVPKPFLRTLASAAPPPAAAASYSRRSSLREMRCPDSHLGRGSDGVGGGPWRAWLRGAWSSYAKDATGKGELLKRLPACKLSLCLLQATCPPSLSHGANASNPVLMMHTAGPLLQELLPYVLARPPK